MTPTILLSACGLLIVAAAAIIVPRLVRRSRRRRLERAISDFRLRREMLEARFVELAGRQNKPPDVHWVCDWQSDVTFAHDIRTGLLTAFAGVHIHFEPIPGGEMDGVDAVGTVRDAVAVFHFEDGRWGTGGKALFNMNPRDALDRLEGQFRPVLPDPASASRSAIPA